MGTNNFAELCALKLLLRLARMHNLDKIQIFGDSQLVINWASGKYKIQNLELALILQEVHYLSDSFDHVSYKHIYRERNSKADLLAKAGGSIHEGFWHTLEQNEADSTETFQVF